MNAAFLDDETLADFLVELETEGLDPAASRELDALLAQAPAGTRDALAPAAAALTLAHRLPADPLPAALGSRLVEQGRDTVPRAAPGKIVPLALASMSALAATTRCSPRLMAP